MLTVDSHPGRGSAAPIPAPNAFERNVKRHRAAKRPPAVIQMQPRGAGSHNIHKGQLKLQRGKDGQLLRKKDGTLKEPSDRMKASMIHRLGAMPYWYNRVRWHGDVWPIPGTHPEQCECRGDCGVDYAVGYVRTIEPKVKRRRDPKNPARLLPGTPKPEYKICFDCEQNRLAPKERSTTEGEKQDDEKKEGRPLYRPISRPWTSSSTSSEAQRELENRGVPLHECPLMPEDAASLKLEISRAAKLVALMEIGEGEEEFALEIAEADEKTRAGKLAACLEIPIEVTA